MHFCKRNGATKLYKLAAVSPAFFGLGEFIHPDEDECRAPERTADRLGTDLRRRCCLSAFCCIVCIKDPFEEDGHRHIDGLTREFLPCASFCIGDKGERRKFFSEYSQFPDALICYCSRAFVF